MVKDLMDENFFLQEMSVQAGTCEVLAFSIVQKLLLPQQEDLLYKTA